MAVDESIARVRREAREVAPADEVDRAIADMAKRIEAEFDGVNPVILPVMHGGAFTAVRLCRHFDFPYEFAYVHASRYGNRLTGGAIEWRVEPDRMLAGRHVLVVDDVIDHGATLRDLSAKLRRRGVASLRIAVLVVKDVAGEPARPRPDFVGITIVEDEYLFGCGMDYKGYWRGLPALYSVPAP